MTRAEGEHHENDETGGGSQSRVPTGVEGLDEILCGGYPEARLMLIEGAPGTGKTTLALQAMVAAAENGRSALFFSVAQSAEELEMIARSHGMNLSDIAVVSPDLSGDPHEGASVDTNAARLDSLLKALETEIREVEPDFLVFDSLLELSMLSPDDVAYRRAMLWLRQMLRAHRVTALLLVHVQVGTSEHHAEGIAHGVIRLEARVPAIGIAHRRLCVTKLRGSPYLEGYHDFRIETGELRVFPRVVPTRAGEGELGDQLATGKTTLDEMLGGGLEFGSTALIAGQSGTGKSTLSSLFATAAAKAGRRAALFLFEERPEIFRSRSSGLGIDLEAQEKTGALRLSHFDPAEISPGEFARAVIGSVEQDGIELVVIDSLSGYLNALPERGEAMTHLHTLIQSVARRGALVVVTVAQSGLIGQEPRTDINTSYLSDTIILLRHDVAEAEVLRTITVLKKRHGQHGQSVQKLEIAPGTVSIDRVSQHLVGRVERMALGAGG